MEIIDVIDVGLYFNVSERLPFINTLFGSLNHFGQNDLHLVPKRKREKKGNYMSKIRYLNSPRLKQDCLDIERKEIGKSLYDLAMDVLISS